jgi:hypothetical protein
MSQQIPTATHFGEIRLGDVIIPCAVIPGPRRLLSQTTTAAAFGFVSGGYQLRKRTGKTHTGDLPPFLSAQNLIPFISNELRTLVSDPIRYRDPRGGPIRLGMESNLLAKVCQVWVEAKNAGALAKIQIPVARRAESLLFALAQVAIDALIDEATGYQEIRDRDALQKLLDKYLLQDYAKWAKRFPDEFYQNIFRLKGWQWRGMKVNRPSVVGHYTNDNIYARLAPGLLEELRRLNPPNEKGRRKVKHQQWLTEDVGHPKLQEHLQAVMALQRASSNWSQYMRMLQRAFPKINTNLELPFNEDEPD